MAIIKTPILNGAGKIVDANLPDRLLDGQLSATYEPKGAAANAAASKLDKTEAASTYALKTELGIAGLQVVYHLGSSSVARPSTSAPVMWVGSVQPSNMIDGDLYMVSAPVEPLTTWHTAYSASKLSLTDGASVSSLTDTSGNARHAVQATSTKQPKWYAGAGTPYVRFDGVDDFLQTPAFAAPLAQPGTMILVAKLATVTTASSPTKEMVNGRTTAGEWSLSQRGVSGNAGSEVWQAGAGIRNNGPATDKPAAGQWFIFTFVVTGTGSYLRVSGSQTAARDFGANSLDAVTLGALYNGAGGFADMDLGEFRLSSRVLTATEISDEETYFAAKYGITL